MSIEVCIGVYLLLYYVFFHYSGTESVKPAEESDARLTERRIVGSNLEIVVFCQINNNRRLLLFFIFFLLFSIFCFGHFTQ